MELVRIRFLGEEYYMTDASFRWRGGSKAGRDLLNPTVGISEPSGSYPNNRHFAFVGTREVFGSAVQLVFTYYKFYPEREPGAGEE